MFSLSGLVISLIMLANILTPDLLVLGFLIMALKIMLLSGFGSLELISNGLFEFYTLNLVLVLMSLMVFIWSVMMMTEYGCSYSSKHYLGLSLLLLMFVLLFFSMKKLLSLYISFELSVIPIFIMIMGWGYQSERLGASMSLFFYTFVASLPLLMSILKLQQWWGVTYLSSLKPMMSLSENWGLFGAGLMLAFLVKLPLFGFHLWLPKAHVEAPVTGSMILAAVLLKLGGLGLYLFVDILFNWKWGLIWLSVGVASMALVSALCLRLSDMKLIIAYSSVAHMGMVVIGLFLFNNVGELGAALMLVSHGFSSSGLFMLAYFIYKMSHSRSLLLNKGLLVLSPFLMMFWFMIIAGSMGTPPSLNFFSEVWVIMSLVNGSFNSSLVVLVSVVLAAGYSLVLYSSSAQGQFFSISSQSLKANWLVLSMFHSIWIYIPIILMLL